VKPKQLLENQSLKTPLLTKPTKIRLRNNAAGTDAATKVVVVSDRDQVDQVDQNLVVVSDGEVHLLKKKTTARLPVSTRMKFLWKK
jgi:hypothetical protein